jgi:hypothetical protein
MDTSIGTASLIDNETNWSLSFTPNIDAEGKSSFIVLMVSNASVWVQTNISVSVIAPAPPTFNGLTDITTPGNVTTNIGFSVVPAAVGSAVTLSASVENTNLGTVTASISATNATNATLVFTPAVVVVGATNKAAVVGATTISVVASSGAASNNSFAQVTNKINVTVVDPLKPTFSGLNPTISIPGNIKVTNDFVVTPGIAGTVVYATAKIADATYGSVSVSGTGTDRKLVFDPKVVVGSTKIFVIASNVFAWETNEVDVEVLAGVEPTMTISDPTMTTPANVAATNSVTAAAAAPGASISISLSASVLEPTMGSAKVTANNGTNRWIVVFTPKGVVGDATLLLVANDGKVSKTNKVIVTITDGLAPVLTTIPMQTVQQNTVLNVAFRVTNSVPDVPTKVTITNDNPNLISSVAITGSNPYLARINLVPYANSNKFGLGTVTLTADNTFGVPATNSFKVNVTWVYTAPSLASLYDQTFKANANVVIPLMVTDPDWDATALTYEASFSNPNLVSGYSMQSSNGAMNLVVNLVTNQIGASAVTVKVGDGTSTVAQGFTLYVVAPTAPTLASIADVTNVANKVSGAVLTIPLDITAGEVAVTNLTVVGTASNTDLISSVTANVTSSNATAIVSIRTLKVGTSVVAVSVSDRVNAAVVQKFNVVVLAPTPPVVNIESNVVIKANQVTTIPITVTSPDTAFSNLSFIVGLSDHTYVSSVALSNTGSNLVATITPTGLAGTADVSITARDGFTNAPTTFTVTVVNPTVPTLIATNVIVKANVSSITNPVAVVVGDVALSNLTFSIGTTNSDLVSGVSLINDGSTNLYAVVNLISNQTGVATINVRADDSYTKVSAPFTVTVNAVDGLSLSATVVDGEVTIAFKGVGNTTYTLQSTTDFSVWSDVGPVTTDAEGSGTYSTSVAPGYTFYRVVLK